MSVRSYWPGESSDMQYDPFRSSLDLGLTWPVGQTLTLTFQSHFIYGSTRLNETNTMVSNSLLYLLKLKILLSKNRFGKFWNFDPWRPQFWPEPKNDRNDFEMIFRELSNAAFRFSLWRPGAEIMGGGGRSNAPPAGGGKSRGPAGRGLIQAENTLEVCRWYIPAAMERPGRDLSDKV